MLVRPIDYDSPAYHAVRELRRRFLREPLGLELTAADVAGEAEQHHYGLFDEPNETTGPAELRGPSEAPDAATAPGGTPSPSGAPLSDTLVGAVIGKPDPDDPASVRIRQMVVHADRRGEGLGRLLLTEAERLLSDRGYTRLVLYARPEAAGFYKRCGYQKTGATAELIGLEHLEMAKLVA